MEAVGEAVSGVHRRTQSQHEQLLGVVAGEVSPPAVGHQTGHDETVGLISGRQKAAYCACCCCPCCRCGSRLACVLCWNGWVVMAILMLLLVAWLIVQAVMNHQSLQIREITLSDPGERTVYVTSEVALLSALTVPCTLGASRVTFNYQQSAFGFSDMEAVYIESGSNPRFAMRKMLQVTNLALFDRFSTDMMMHDELELGLRMTTTVHIHIGAMDLPFPQINVDKTSTVRGFGGLQNATVGVLTLFVDADGALCFTAPATVWNPSAFDIRPLGNLSLDMYYRGALLSRISALDVDLVRGPNVFMGVGRLLDSNQPLFNDMFSKYMMGDMAHFTAWGTPGAASSIALYNGFLANVSMHIALPGAWHWLCRQALMDTTAATFDREHLRLVIPTRLLLYNAWPVPTNITAVNQWIAYNGTVVATCNTTVDCLGRPLNIEIPPNGTAWTTDVPIVADLTIAGDHLKAFITSILHAVKQGMVLLSIGGRVTIHMSDVTVSPFYSETILPVCSNGTRAHCDNFTQSHPSSPYDRQFQLAAQSIARTSDKKRFSLALHRKRYAGSHS